MLQSSEIYYEKAFKEKGLRGEFHHDETFHNSSNPHSGNGLEGEENFVGDSEIIALGGASNETKDRPLG